MGVGTCSRPLRARRWRATWPSGSRPGSSRAPWTDGTTDSSGSSSVKAPPPCGCPPSGWTRRMWAPWSGSGVPPSASCSCREVGRSFGTRLRKSAPVVEGSDRGFAIRNGPSSGVTVDGRSAADGRGTHGPHGPRFGPQVRSAPPGSDAGPVPLLGGVRMSGRVGRQTVGFRPCTPR